GVAGDTSFSAFGPNPIGTTLAVPNSQIPIVPGDPRSSLSAGFNSSVTNPPLSSGFNPAVASPFLPHAALPQSSALNPTVTRPGALGAEGARPVHCDPRVGPTGLRRGQNAELPHQAQRVRMGPARCASLRGLHPRLTADAPPGQSAPGCAPTKRTPWLPGEPV